MDENTREIGELKETTTKEIGELRGMTFALLRSTRTTWETGEDESAGSPKLGRQQEETPEQQVEMPAAEIGLVRRQRKKPRAAIRRPQAVDGEPRRSGESTDRDTQATARSEAN